MSITQAELAVAVSNYNINMGPQNISTSHDL